MKKKKYISLILLFVFSIFLLHNIIPHHHHDEISDINNHEHKHHHDKKEKDHHNENDEPIGFFSHPTHILASTEFIFSSNLGVKKTQNITQFFPIDNFVVKPTIISIKREPPNYTSVIPIQFSRSINSLRGPPVFSV